MIYWKSNEDNNWKENHCMFPRLISQIKAKTFPFLTISYSSPKTSSSPFLHFSFFKNPLHFHFLSTNISPPIVTSLGHGELEDDPEEDAEGDDAKDDPDDDEVAGAAAEAVVLLRRRRRRLVAVVPLPHRELAGGPILSKHHPMVVWHGGAVVLVVTLGKGGHARVQRLWFNLPTSLAMPSKAAVVPGTSGGTSVTRHLGHGTSSADCRGSRYHRLGHRVATWHGHGRAIGVTRHAIEGGHRHHWVRRHHAMAVMNWARFSIPRVGRLDSHV